MRSFGKTWSHQSPANDRRPSRHDINHYTDRHGLSESAGVHTHFTPDSYNDDLRLLSEFGIPVKKPRLRPDAVPTVFSHRPILQAKRRGAFEKRQRKEVWKEEQEGLLSAAVGRDMVIAGDGRSDSPGFSAKFGTYSMLDVTANKIIHLELVQVTGSFFMCTHRQPHLSSYSVFNDFQSNEVGGSCHMELEGLKRGLNYLQGRRVKVSTLITDRHAQIRKYLANNHSDTDHRYDVWHVGKVSPTLQLKNLHDTATEEPDLPPSATSSSADVTDDLRGWGVLIPVTVTFEDFANVNSAVSSCADLNDDDMIEQVLQPPDSGSNSDDDDAPCAPEPSHADLWTLFFHCINIAVVNSFILFEADREDQRDIEELSGKTGFDQLAFRIELVNQMLGMEVRTQAPGPRKALEGTASADAGTACEPDEREAAVIPAGLRDALEDVSFNDYIDADRCAAVCGTITDDDIIAQITGREAPVVDVGAVDEEDEAPTRPSASELMEAMHVARLFFSFEEGEEDAFRHVHAFKNKAMAIAFKEEKQTVITDYFRK
ncbi:hypothetical protein HPB52_012661 [Rhipicephalus sanguineus]|uniref:Uncharacterized protein n=1 Tax=Rhipicephalus sanguineus TaxID=34632 RepID=A0A9D4QAY1_RHISA|nr:hypothetical protein HPB52_012661 [Rhipicephalus sanguineus]